MTLAGRLACNAALLRMMVEAPAPIWRADLLALARDLAAEAEDLDRAEARRSELEYRTQRRAA